MCRLTGAVASAWVVVCIAIVHRMVVTSRWRGSTSLGGLSQPARPDESDILVTLESQFPGGIGRLDREDIDAVVRWLLGSLHPRRPDPVALLIGEQGTQLAAFGVRANYAGMIKRSAWSWRLKPG